MEKVKLAIVYYSATGINYQLARWAEEAAVESGAEVRVVRIAETAPDAAIFSVPTRFGGAAAQAKQFLDQQGGLWAQGKLANKVVSAMSSAQNPHGGQEATILSLYTTMYHWGAIVVSPGYTDDSIFKAGGNPYGTSVSQGQDGKTVEDVEDAVKHQARRTIQVAGWVKAGKQSN
jgi:NAD(P)H dehydrogenase (quinone)